MIREILNERVQTYAQYHGGDYRMAWNVLYKRFLRRFHVNLKVRARNRKMRPIEYAEQNGFICLLLGLALQEYYGY